MASAADLAVDEVNASGGLLDDRQIVVVRADSACTDTGAAVTSGERLVTADGVAAIVGALCSGATTAVLQKVALPNGVLMISPSSTSPALSTVEDDDLFLCTVPSDARQGQIVADILMEKGIEEVVVTYTNNDYGKDTLRAAAAILRSCTKPLILAGGGARGAATSLQALAEQLDAPVVMTTNARGLMGASPLRVPVSPTLDAVRQAIAASDVVLALSTEFASPTTTSSRRRVCPPFRG